MLQSVSQLSDRFGPTVIAFALGLAAAEVLSALGQLAELRVEFPPVFERLNTAWQTAREWILQLSSSQPPLAWLAGAIVIACLAAVLALGQRSTKSQHAPNERFSEAERLQKSVLDVEVELVEILASIKKYMVANKRYSQSLDRAASNLRHKPSAQQVTEIVQLLIAENQQFRKETKRLNDDLALSRNEISRLTADLTEAQKEGLRDALTSIGNRRLFDLVLSESIVKAQDADASLALVMADIDHFKSINDDYGHPVGDEVLKRFARLLKRNVKGRDTVARYGGEEFALILPSTDQEDAFKLVEHIRSQLHQTRFSITETGEDLRAITASFGVTTYAPGEEKSQLIARADKNLYEAKKSGRNRTVLV